MSRGHLAGSETDFHRSVAEMQGTMRAGEGGALVGDGLVMRFRRMPANDPAPGPDP